jgi:hypothetical protein
MAAASPCTSEFVRPRQNESEFERLGIVGKHPPPYHLQTCGKIERFHQTQKRWAREATTPGSLAELGAHLDRLRLLYNQHRPHRAIGRRTPQAVFGAKVKAGPGSARGPVHYRVRPRRPRWSGDPALCLATPPHRPSAAGTVARRSCCSSPTVTSGS